MHSLKPCFHKQTILQIILQYYMRDLTIACLFTAFLLLCIIGMETDEFVVAVCMKLWFWFHSMKLLPNIEIKLHSYNTKLGNVTTFPSLET